MSISNKLCKIRRKLQLILSLVLISSTSFAQTPIIQWQNTIGGDLPDFLISIESIPDGGYILGGISRSGISGDKSENSMGGNDYWVIKIDSIGNIMWQNTIGGSQNDELSIVSLTDDGGYILGGTSRSDSTGDKTENSHYLDDYWIIKTDLVGSILWQNTIGGNRGEYLTSIQQTSDGGYIVGGFSGSDSSGDKMENNLSILFPNSTHDYWVLKLDSLGNIMWQNTIGGNKNDKLFAITQASDGGYVLGGFSDSGISGDKTENPVGGLSGIDFWVVKIDTVGNIQWQNTIGGNGTDELRSIDKTLDGGYILGGPSWSLASGDKTESSWGDQDYWVVKIDSVGNIQWQNDIGGTSEDKLSVVKQLSDGGYILSGHSFSNSSGDKTEDCLGGFDYWIVRLDSTGNIQWQNTIGGSLYDWNPMLQITTDGGYILGGFSGSSLSGDKTENCIGGEDYWIVKIAPDSFTSVSTTQIKNIGFQVNPNPSSGKFSILFNDSYSEKTIQIIDELGNTIYNKESLTGHEQAIDLSNNSKGLYFLKVITEKDTSIIKIILQ